ncbi:TonB-dependent receptor [Novosphingobium lentum]|uniref:TonB-dependent receptor n=1 Tax=Novosphingobium lentum TaxID=145287 RepID=UPI00082FD39D|nr:TonB-dependent receptor [Novosphingobium lentum]
MQLRFFLAASVASLSLAAGLSTPVMAQETSSAMQGSVTASGKAVAGAAVTITHVPSGTTTVATTDGSGVFNANGLRPGGPFTVKVSAAGYPDASITDVYTVVGQTFSLPIDLSSSDLSSPGSEGGAIIVTATRIKGAGSLSAGPTTVLTTQDIAKVASVNRDIRDLIQRDPFATLDTSQSSGRQVTFAGQNPRFNRFTIDGVAITDSFGLNPDALPSRRGPVPLDSIGQFETKVAPYDIREGFFQGGVINAILRSGTNSFQGTAFYSFSSDELTGKKTKSYITNPTGVVTQPNFTSKDFGVELSGPIIADKLFFMVAAERVRASLPVPNGTVDDNAGSPVTNLTSATVAQIQAISKARYNFDPGGILRTNGDKDDRIVGKLDANLSDTQRLSLTGLYTKDSQLVATTTSNTSLGLESNAYIKPNKLRAGILQLNSQWSDNFSTEARAIYKAYDSGQFPLLGRTAAFTICTAPTSDRTAGGATTTNVSLSCPTNVPTVVIGSGGPSQSNILTVRSWGGSLVGRLIAGDHNVRELFEFNHTKTYNLFVNPSAGTYYFDSLADFQNGNSQSFSYNNAGSLNPNDAAAKFSYTTYTFGLQDDWRVNPMLNVSLGVRYDLFGSGSRPALNPNWFKRYGYSNTSFLSGRGLFQPRFGFTFKPMPRLIVRGGGGIFGGGSPDVYAGNAFSNTGVLNTSITARQTDGGVYQLNGAASAAAGTILNNPSFTTIPTAADTALQAAAAGLTTNPNATTTLNALDPNLKIPSQFRATLSTSYTANLGPLGDGWVFGLDGLYSKVRSQLIVTDLRSIPIAGSLTPDGRQRYTSKIGNANDTGQDLLLTNTKYGRSYIGVARLSKHWDFGLDTRIAYTYQDVRDAGALTSSIASSLYNNGSYLDPNFGAPGHSNDEVRWAFKYNVSFEHAFFGDAKTRLDIFGETRAGSPYSYVFQDTSGGRSTTFGTAGSNSRYLFYVPTGINDPLVAYDSAATATRIDQIIAGSGLAQYRGQIAPRNAFRSKAFTRIDLHLEQEVPLPLGSKFSVFGDIENVTNLINHNWGQQLRANFPYSKIVSKVTCVAVGANACAQYKYSSPSNDTTLADQLITTNGSSLYTIRVGVRLSF